MSEEDFERLYAEHAKPLLAFLAFRTGDRVLADDLVADTFERVLRARRGFDRRRGGEKTWIYSIALNRLRDQTRRREVELRANARTETESRTDTANSESSRVEDRDTLERALSVLTPDELEAISLRFGGDLTNPEIAEITGKPLTTIEGRIYRGLRKMRAAL